MALRAITAAELAHARAHHLESNNGEHIFDTDFGDAVRLMRAGHRLGRKGWNAPGQYVVLRPGYPGGVPLDESTAHAVRRPVGAVGIFNEYFLLCAADGSFVPWQPTARDSLAYDWGIVE